MRTFIFGIFCIFFISISAPAEPQKDPLLCKTSLSKINITRSAALVGAMVGTAAASTYLTGALPEKYKFAAMIISQLSVLGLAVAAPILDPLHSKVKKIAFGGTEENQELEAMWYRIQQSLSINGQMSRNVLSQFLLLFQQNLSNAFSAYSKGDLPYAVSQVALAAVVMRLNYKEILPSDSTVALFVNANFTSHFTFSEDFIQSVRDRIYKLDSQSQTEEAKNYYNLLLSTWFKPLS